VRKLWYAGAVVAGGIFLFGAAVPAQADLLPGTGTAEQQADERLADLLGASNGVNMDNPLRFSTLGTTPIGASPVLNFKSGQNSPDLNPLLPGEPAAAPAGESATRRKRHHLPAADVVSGALNRPGGQQLPLNGLPVGGLVGGLPLLGGLLPNGGTPGVLQRPTTRQAEAFDGGVPLLGGLGGLLPVNGMPKVADIPDTTGMPAGGMAILPAATTPPAFGQSAAAPARPAAGQPVAGQTAADQAPADQTAGDQTAGDQTAGDTKPAVSADDPRLHEEPVDGEAQRAFSADGRPIAGIDQQYK
jgi:hypothetical protein